ncbi:phosphatidylinositol 4-phosphate 3-kinase C2 domain-containing subunit beta-like isoform X3 [Asterias amurensis]|uniref:phosphatidylinositol 4-phosphate 3-kinase C2 domain-containing subunit beta-like isoform X3 n=1 Tax=Asterias amurensis TaxID=7602 RepID=UPI003AB84210
MAHTTQPIGQQDQRSQRTMNASDILDKQYEDDLQKAIALSVETEKLDELQRAKRMQGLKRGSSSRSGIDSSRSGISDGGGNSRSSARTNESDCGLSRIRKQHGLDVVSTASSGFKSEDKSTKTDESDCGLSRIRKQHGLDGGVSASPGNKSGDISNVNMSENADLMLFSFDHVMKNFDTKVDVPKSQTLSTRSTGHSTTFGGSLSMQSPHTIAHPQTSAQFGSRSCMRGQSFQGQSSFQKSSSSFKVPRPTSTHMGSTKWNDPFLNQKLAGSGSLQTTTSKTPPSVSSFLPKQTTDRRTSDFNVLSCAVPSPKSPKWQVQSGYRDDTLIGAASSHSHHSQSSGSQRLSGPLTTKELSLDSFSDLANFGGHAQIPRSISPTPSTSMLKSRLSNVNLSETNSIRRISSNPNFTNSTNSAQQQTASQTQTKTQTQRQVTESSNMGFSSSFSVSTSSHSTSSQQNPSAPGKTPSLVDEIWMQTFGTDSSKSTKKSGSDLMMFSPKTGQKSPDVFDFSEFDPLRVVPPELPPKRKHKENGESAVATETSKDAEDGDSEDSKAKSEASKEDGQVDTEAKPATPQALSSETKPDVTRRPKSVHSAGRPLSGVDIAKPEPWIPGSTYTLSAGKKAEATRVFFGDGLFDLAAEKDEEATAFAMTVARIRDAYKYDDEETNPGCIRSPVFINSCHANLDTSVKVVLLQSGTKTPIVFTCDVNICVQHVISQALCYVDASDISSKKFVLKVPGLSEYLQNNVQLSSYEYVQECLKLDKDVTLVLLHRAEMNTSLKRMAEDDDSDISQINFSSLFERPVTTAVSKKGLDVLLHAFTVEGDKLKAAVKSGAQPKTGPLIQTVKAICFTLASIEPNEISTAIREFQTASTDHEAVFEKLSTAVLRLVDLYCASFDTDFRTGTDDTGDPPQDITVKGHNLRVCVASAHRLPNNIKNAHEFYSVSAQLYYGGNSLHFSVDTWPSRINSGFFDKLAWNQELELPVPVSQLPREARLILTLYGHDSSSTETRNADKTILGWVAIPLFNFRGEFQRGSHLLGLWADSSVNPIGTCSSNLLSQTSIILQVNFEDTRVRSVFPEIHPLEDKVFKFDNLEPFNRCRVQEILETDVLSSLSSEDAMFLWSKRHYLHDFPSALPRILEVAPTWDWACLADIYSLLRHWKPPKPVQTLQLLHPRFADREVRCTAVKWMQSISDDELCDYLPQLVQALKYESYHDSALARFLIDRSIQSIRVAHYLYWYLKDSLREQQYKQRIEMILGALLSVCSKGLRHQFRLQEALIENLNNIAEQVKAAKDANRMSLLHASLETVVASLESNVLMPTNPSLEIRGLNLPNCGYYNSFTVPLKLVLYNADSLAEDVTIMYKAGDDLRQDMLTMQMIRIMDKLWLSEGLDLRMITFRCIGTGHNRGLVELVGESQTMRKIQVEHGLTGSFKDKPLSVWLQKHNPTELDYRKAVENFTYSCAGYCVATYVLGIGDRHNDNIMVARTGHMFHIDFGKFLGNAQMFGNIKRDRTAFVLTPEMAYVINGGEKQSSRFQMFVDLCSEAFNLVRNHADTFFNLFGLMLNAGIGQLSKPEDLSHVQNALRPQASNTEATTWITRLIEASLGSKATQINFFIHNLAHHSFSAANSQELSFAPKRYTMATDGKIASASLYGIQKRYENEKYYVYIVSILRENSTVPSFIFRRYSEFSELNQKLAILYPKARMLNLRSGPLVGRTHVKQVAEKRKNELDVFLRQLFAMPAEISLCDLVYTFFHPSLRDEKDAHLAHKSVKLKNGPLFPIDTDDDSKTATEPTFARGEISGRVKLAIHYKSHALLIMVRHAVDLLALDKGQPDPYVKIYLLPDPHKQTKRKTRIQKKTSNPTYNEMLVYNFPWSEVLNRTIRLTAWDSDYLKENNFLGGIDIPVSSLDLSVETVGWYKLGNLT